MINLHNGKTDPNPSLLLMLWSNEDAYPVLDPVWLLKLWLRITKISSGYLFASKERLESAVPLEQAIKDGEQLTQDMLDRVLRNTAIQVLGRSRKFTGRSCRPTAFCVDIFRGAGDASLLQTAARSAGPSNVPRYARGSTALLQTFRQPYF